jgi:hypothetical protein
MRTPSEFEPTQPQTHFMHTTLPFVGRRQPLHQTCARAASACGSQKVMSMAR